MFITRTGGHTMSHLQKRLAAAELAKGPRLQIGSAIYFLTNHQSIFADPTLLWKNESVHALWGLQCNLQPWANEGERNQKKSLGAARLCQSTRENASLILYNFNSSGLCCFFVPFKKTPTKT